MGGGDVCAPARQRRAESLREAARALRYAFFASLPGLIATAHTQDDNLETVLLNLTRGTGLAGLCGIPPKRKSFIRPHAGRHADADRGVSRAKRLFHVTDSTNFLPDARRNRLRQSVIPLLKAENPSLCETAFRMCRLLEADEAQLSAQAEVVLQQARIADGVQCSILAAYPQAVRTRAVKLLLGEIHAPKLSARHIDAVDRLLFSACPSAAHRCRADTLHGENMTGCFLPLTPCIFEPVVLSIGESAVLQPSGLAFSANGKKIFQKFKIRSPLLQ